MNQFQHLRKYTAENQTAFLLAIRREVGLEFVLVLIAFGVAGFLTRMQLRRIGGNINQIAYQLNSGVLEGWHEEFNQALEILSELQRFITGDHGLR